MDKPFKVYLFEYFHDDSWWQIEIPATSADDAQARAQKIARAKLAGELVAKIPASAGGGVLAPLVCWLRNFFWGR